jgi:hypothetical protein
MNKVIEDLISEAQEEVWGTNPHNGSPEFEGYTVDPELLVKLTIKKVLSLIAIEQDKAEQNWQCKDGIHISWKIQDLVKDVK